MEASGGHRSSHTAIDRRLAARGNPRRMLPGPAPRPRSRGFSRLSVSPATTELKLDPRPTVLAQAKLIWACKGVRLPLTLG
jgi:hypothetical protein